MTTVNVRIAADSSNMYAKGVSSPDAIRSFRARNRSLANRAAANLSRARLLAQSNTHIQTLKHPLETVDQLHPGIFLDASRIWNWDNTSVLIEYGKPFRCYTSSRVHSGSARRSIWDSGKHVTAGITVAACGSVAFIFIVASGKRVWGASNYLLSKQDFTCSLSIPRCLCGEKLFPTETAPHVTEHGSVDGNVIVKIAEHILNHERKTVSSEKTILL